MALALYWEPNENSKYDDSHPFTVTFDGRVGGIIDKLVYLRNDDGDYYYDNIIVDVLNTQGQDLTTGEVAGWYWKLSEGNIPLTHEEWAAVRTSTELDISFEIGSASRSDTLTYIPIWVRVSTPRGQAIQTLTNIQLRVQAREHLR